MKSLNRSCFVRLLVAALLNFVLVVLALSVGAPVWGGWERPYYFHLFAGAVATIALVLLVPVLWRGRPLEIILALFFAAQPVCRLYLAFAFCLGVRWPCC
jgi:hypothetical protein